MRLLVGIPPAAGEQMAVPLPGWDVVFSPPDRLREHLDGVDVLCPVMAPVDADTLRAGRCGLVHQFGVGLETVDVAAATDLGRLGGPAAQRRDGQCGRRSRACGAADPGLNRRLDEARSGLRGGRWNQPGGPLAPPGDGADRRARRPGDGGRSQAVGVRRGDHRGSGAPGTRRTTADQGCGGADRLIEVLGGADVVVCCARYDTVDAVMFGSDQFTAVKPGALFVNVARGGLVDASALQGALDSGQLAGAGLDVFATEPADPQDPLVTHPRVLATPHVGGMTLDVLQRSAVLFAENLQRWANGEAPRWAVNTPAAPRGTPNRSP